MDKDLYEVLEIKKSANETEIRKAFLRFAKKYHPDVNPNDKVSEHKFKEINLAYEVLKDPKKRQHYDQMRAVGANPFAQRPPGGQPWGGTSGMGPDSFSDFGLGDLFDEIFSSGGMGSRSSGRRGAGQGPFGRGFPQKGGDRLAKLEVSLLEASQGGDKNIEFEDGKKLTIKIPEGVDTGIKIKLSGQGERGIQGGPNGDLILTIEVLAHAFFIRENNDIILKLPCTFSEVVLGQEIEVPTLTGKVHLKIPKGISSGQRLKLAGKGIRSPKTGQKGDQFVEILIKIPKEIPPSYIEAAEKIGTESFNPRANIF
ncbi:MAG: J domain-containing protein [Bdellovibrionales bacterium]|nr:J domain-containing protein [Bdellovibrionales bacterium]